MQSTSALGGLGGSLYERGSELLALTDPTTVLTLPSLRGSWMSVSLRAAGQGWIANPIPGGPSWA